MENLLIFAWFGGFAPWSVAIALYWGLRRDRTSAKQQNCVCCGYSTSAEICPECGASKADRLKRIASEHAEKGLVAIAACVLSMLVAMGVLAWFDPGVLISGMVCILPIPIAVLSILLLQRSVVSIRVATLTAVCLVALFGVLYFALLHGVHGSTDGLAYAMTYVLASIIIAPLLGYALVPSIIVLLLRAVPNDRYE